MSADGQLLDITCYPDYSGRSPSMSLLISPTTVMIEAILCSVKSNQTSNINLHSFCIDVNGLSYFFVDEIPMAIKTRIISLFNRSSSSVDQSSVCPFPSQYCYGISQPGPRYSWLGDQSIIMMIHVINKGKKSTSLISLLQFSLQHNPTKSPSPPSAPPPLRQLTCCRTVCSP